jgi:hypothetical protein
MAKVNLGKMPCETCGNTVTVKQNELGTLSYRCDECDAAPYAKAGTLQNQHWRTKLTSLTKNDLHNHDINDLKQEVNTEVPPPIDKKDVPTVNNIWGIE